MNWEMVSSGHRSAPLKLEGMSGGRIRYDYPRQWMEESAERVQDVEALHKEHRFLLSVSFLNPKAGMWLNEGGWARSA